MVKEEDLHLLESRRKIDLPDTEHADVIEINGNKRYEDTARECKECGEPFVILASELQWLEDKFGVTFKPPVRCKDCRKRRKDITNPRF